MRLSSIQPGDIVQAADLHATVLRKEGRQLVVQSICGHAIRRLHGDEIDKHWRQSRRAA